MSQPTLWPNKTFFYPVGNTTPCCFTQDLCPEQEANILLLACGDPRSILYTVFTDLSTYGRKMDFTCADWQPGVLARNILLFSMIIDGEDPLVMFSVFYNFFLDSKALTTLIVHCNFLIASSVDTKTWMSSKYHQLIRFTTRHSMECIRRYWFLYKETADLSAMAKEQLKSTFLAGMKLVLTKMGRINSMSLALSTGPLISSFLNNESARKLSSHEELWTNGVVSCAIFKTAVLNLLNPTFVHSLDGDAFSVHYGTDPLKAFHLAPAFASTKEHSAPASSVADITKSCVSQFAEWCSSFKSRFENHPGTIVIRIFVGEALALCRALRYRQERSEVGSGAYTYPWGGSQIILDAEYYGTYPSAPISFNVIDTSNLTDHCGLLNLLTVSVPLLHRSSSSVLHTHTLLPAEPDRITSGLAKKTFTDIPSLSLLLGVAPTPFTSHFATTSYLHAFLVAPARHFPETISWKFTSGITISGPNQAVQTLQPSSLAIGPDILSQYLVSIYHRMFAEENPANMNFANVQMRNKVLYLRSSFVSFIQLIKARISTDWVRVIEKTIDLIAQDRTLLKGARNYQELVCQLHLQGLYTIEWTLPGTPGQVRTRTHRLSAWRNVPPVVCIALRIPRYALKTIKSLTFEDIGHPLLQCETSSPGFHNIHPSIQPIFGDIQASSVDGEDRLEIIDDPQGLKGSSDLIATFYICSALLIAFPSMEVGLHFRDTPSASFCMPQCGMTLKLFSTSLQNLKQVFISRHRPCNPREGTRLQIHPQLQADVSSLSSHVTLSFNELNTRVTTIIMRDNISDSAEATSLSGGAEIRTRQVADCGILVTFEGYHRLFIFPYPVQGNDCKTRIARKSLYIEIVCPIRPDFSNSNDPSLNLFPVHRNDQSFNLVNVHYLNLDVMPALLLPAPENRLQWVFNHLEMTLSNNERAFYSRKDSAFKPTLVKVKQTIISFFLSHMGMSKHTGGQHSKVVALTSDSKSIKMYALVFVNDIKLDLPGHTILGDACVVPITIPIAQNASLRSRLMDEGLFNVITDDDEARAWRQLLVVAAERCRTWQHGPNCEYIFTGIPRILDGLEESPLCSCGKGKNLGAFGRNPKWAMVHKEATRIALSPLIAHPFLDDSAFSPSDVTRRDPTSPLATSVPQSAGAGKSEQCAKCAKTGVALQACSVCRTTKYCSRDCQRSHWKVHKPQCKTATP